MNREIKFRAWDKERKEMWNPHKKIFKYLVCGRRIADLTAFLDNEAYELMQFTGLLDKNRKEICEGDIVERQGVETWTETGNAKCVVEDIRYLNHIIFHEGYEIEVIGNIYENKDLIK